MATGDTGFLSPLIGSPASFYEEYADQWIQTGQFALDGSKYAYNGYRLTAYNTSGTEPLVWNWHVPVGSYPANATVVGLEVKLWIGMRLHNPEDFASPPANYCHVHHLHLGDADVFDNDFTAASEVEDQDADWLTYPTVWPTAITQGGASSLFGLAPGTLVSAFLAQVSKGAYHSWLQVTDQSGTEEGAVTEVRAFKAELKIHYEYVDASNMAATPGSVAAVPTQNLQKVDDMEATVAAVASITAPLVITQLLAAAPAAVASIAMDITEGAGNIDSSALPAAVASLEADIVLPKDMSGANFSVVAAMELENEEHPNLSVLEKSVNLAATPGAVATISPYLYGNEDMYVDGSFQWMIASLSADLQLDAQIAATPGAVASISADLTGTFMIAIECIYDLEPWTCGAVATLTVFPESTFGLISTLPAVATLTASELAHVTAMAATPTAVASILNPYLVSKFGEEVPCDRTISLCPKERDIELNCLPRYM